MGNVCTAKSAVEASTPRSGDLEAFLRSKDGDAGVQAQRYQAAAPPNSSPFPTLLAAYTECDPAGTGYITDIQRFATVAQAFGVRQDDLDEAWANLDMDGNGAVSFPEFVEWAQSRGIFLPLGFEEGAGADGQEDDAALGPGGLPLPPGWRGHKNDPTWNRRFEVTEAEVLSELQNIIDLTYKKVWTRDRKSTGRNEVPTAFKLTRALHSENYQDWKRYYMKRHQIVQACSYETFNGGWFQNLPALTTEARNLCWRHRLRQQTCNEWLLFHGTNPSAVEAICGGDFTMHLAGTATGTLYGRGTYFAESITKADEYASPDSSGDCCVLLCRVVGGKVLYTDESEPDANKLQEQVLQGKYHSVIGDREKCRGTFKEYVVFDADQVFVEYALFYKRVYQS